MAFDFPASPTVGQLFMPVAGVSYIFNGSGWVLSSGASVQASDFGFRATKGGTNQTSFAQDTNTKLTFTTEELDRGGYYDAPNSRWTPPAGFVHLSCTINFGGSSGGLGVYLGFAKNGVVQKLHYYSMGTGEGGLNGMEAMFDDYANGTDYYEAFCRFGGVSGGYIEGDILRSYFQGHITGGRGPQGPQGIPGAPGSSVLLATYDLGGLPQFFNLALPTTYDVVEFDCFLFVPGSAIGLRVSTDGGASYAASGYWQAGPFAYFTTGSNAGGVSYSAVNTTQFNLTLAVTMANASHPSSLNLKVKKPCTAGAFFRPFEWRNTIYDGTNYYHSDVAGIYAASSVPLTHVQFITMSGAAWSAGSWIKMYGR